MKIQQFLEHFGLVTNPFADEDAQTDLVFKGACISSVFHPAWDKIYGDPTEPATSVIFGEKGSGKTAMRMQVVRRLADYNADHPDRQVFVIQYDDFNPFLDRFRERFHGRNRRIDRALAQWRLWDHIDAVLSLAVTQLVDRTLEVRQARHPAARDEPLPIEKLDPSQVRDVALLAAVYDQSTGESPAERWQRLRKKLRFPIWKSYWTLAAGGAVTVLSLVLFLWLGWSRIGSLWPWMLVTIAAGWLPWVGRFAKNTWRSWQIGRATRVLNHAVGPLRKILARFPAPQLVGQPLPVSQQTDQRYQLLEKLQSALRTMRFEGIIVLVDRVDEPYLINGSNGLMQALVWPMLDNKFLKHTGLGVKLLLPIELEHAVDRQERDFHERARLDKQNLIRSLAWTGQSLYDLANARLKACAGDGRAASGAPTVSDLIDPAIDQRRLKDALATLRVPRHLFKFFYRLFMTHCNAHGEENPVWRIGQGEFESVLALYQRDQDALDRGVGAG